MNSVFLFAFTALLAVSSRTSADDAVLRIHLISASEEYRAEASLRQLQATLESDYERILTTASWGKDGGDDLPGLSVLPEADLVIIFARRMNLPEEQIQHLQDYFKAEKPAIGIRTSSHAFQNYLEMDADIFGGNYSGHGKDENVAVSIAADAEEHPILEKIEAWTRPGKIYRNPDLGPNATPLLYGRGQSSGLHEPLAWTNRYGESGRTFYTSIGLPGDFENENFRTMLFNAIEWLTGQKLVLKTEESG